MVSTSAFMLGLIGGLLDFASATSLLLNGSTQSGMGIGMSSVTVALALYLLGILVITTTLLSATFAGMKHSRLLSVLMMVYGVAMVVTGWIMASEMVSTAITSLYIYGMIAVGVVMVVNGALMTRSRVEV